MTANMRILILSIIVFCTTLNGNSQELKYGDLFDYYDYNWNKEPNENIKCEEFFTIREKAIAIAFINHDCRIYPNIKGGLESLEKLILYPVEAEKYQISGYVYVNVLIDKNGKLICHEIKTELGESFVKQAENILSRLEFEQAVCNEKYFAYSMTIPIKFEYKKKR